MLVRRDARIVLLLRKISAERIADMIRQRILSK